MSFEMGEGLVGQVAQTGEVINLNEVPDGYIQVISGLGKASPSSLIIYPVKKNEEVIAVFELASFLPFDDNKIILINNSVEILVGLIDV